MVDSGPLLREYRHEVQVVGWVLLGAGLAFSIWGLVDKRSPCWLRILAGLVVAVIVLFLGFCALLVFLVRTFPDVQGL